MWITLFKIPVLIFGIWLQATIFILSNNNLKTLANENLQSISH